MVGVLWRTTHPQQLLAYGADGACMYEVPGRFRPQRLPAPGAEDNDEGSGLRCAVAAQIPSVCADWYPEQVRGAPHSAAKKRTREEEEQGEAAGREEERRRGGEPQKKKKMVHPQAAVAAV